MKLSVTRTAPSTTILQSSKTSKPPAPVVVAAADAGDERWTVEATGWISGAVEEYRRADGTGGWSAWRPLSRIATDGRIDPTARYSLYRAPSGGQTAQTALQLRQIAGGRSSNPSTAFYVPGGVADRPAPVLAASLPDQRLTVGGADVAIDLRTIFSDLGAGSASFAVVSAPTGVAIDPDGHTLRITPAVELAAATVVVRADNRIPNGRDGFADPAAGAFHADIGGIRDAAFTLDVTAVSTIEGALAGLTISPSQTTVDGYEGVVFKVAGVDEATLRNTEFLWDFGASEDYEFVHLDADFPGDRRARYGRGSVVGHVYHNSTGADVARDVVLKAWNGSEFREVSLSGLGLPLITVRDPDVVFGSGGTVYVGDPARYADIATFRAAARAGTVVGITAAEATATPDDQFVLHAEHGVWLKRNETNRRNGYRVLVQRGAVFDVLQSPPDLSYWSHADRAAINTKTGTEQRDYAPKYLRQIGAFGVDAQGGASPWRIDAPAAGTPVGEMFRNVDQIETANEIAFSRHAFWGFEVRGVYDPANPNRSDLGVIDYFSNKNIFGVGANNIIDRKVTISDVVLSGADAAFSSTGLRGLILANSKIFNWRNYTIFGQLVDSVIVGNHMKQPLDTKWRIGANSVKSANPSQHPNYADHGTRFNEAYGVGVHQNDIRQRGGWSGGRQPVIRAGVQYAGNHDAAAQYYLSQSSTPGDFYDRFGIPRRMHMSVAGNRLDGISGGVNFGYENTSNWLVPPLALTTDGNFIRVERPTTGGFGPFAVSGGNAVFRNDFIFAPDWEAGYPGASLVGAGGNASVVLYTPSGTLAEMEKVVLKNITYAGRVQAAGSLIPFESPTYYNNQFDKGRLQNNTSGRNHYNGSMSKIDPFLPVELAGNGPYDEAGEGVIASASGGPTWADVSAWIQTNWDSLTANFLLGQRPQEDYVLQNALIDFGDSTLANAGSYDTALGFADLYIPPAQAAFEAGADATRLDFTGALRPATKHVGAIEPTSTPGFASLPDYAAPVVSTRFETLGGTIHDPQDGDVFGVDFTGTAFVDDAGSPPLMERDLAVVTERDVGGVWAALAGGETVAVGEKLRIRADTLTHPAKEIDITGASTTVGSGIPAIGPAAAIRDDEDVTSYTRTLGAFAGVSPGDRIVFAVGGSRRTGGSFAWRTMNFRGVAGGNPVDLLPTLVAGTQISLNGGQTQLALYSAVIPADFDGGVNNEIQITATSDQQMTRLGAAAVVLPTASATTRSTATSIAVDGAMSLNGEPNDLMVCARHVHGSGTTGQTWTGATEVAEAADNAWFSVSLTADLLSASGANAVSAATGTNANMTVGAVFAPR